MRVLVTGAAGDVGSRVAASLSESGHEVVRASRRTGVDLVTGAGLDAAVEGADAVVHAASSDRSPRQVEVDGLRRLTGTIRRSGRPVHVVTVSIVGCDRIAFPYYRVKAEAERVLEASGVPGTVVRATQFHSLAAYFAQLLQVRRLAFTIGSMRIQPVDVEWVAQRLAGHAVGPAPEGFHRAQDLAGPTVYDLHDLTRLLAEHAGTPAPRVLRIPPVLPALRDVSQGRVLAGVDALTGGRSFEEWLAQQPTVLPRQRRVPG
ncbi:SDR family oxidoreductase [Serinicoccus kebangsaanensis]|uniref:SDR family oxidoreductase n=1 Tax=Serinicoccus kebangsaanensis TaxID=2602069 RepID=UPI00124D209C|nr:NAD(P)H-binding protein [Serinicoccus kebangsaanensis]